MTFLRKQIIDEPTLIVYYCRECQKIVRGLSKGNKERYSFFCPLCHKLCIYATAKSLIHYFRIKEHSENGQILLQLQQERLKELGLS